MDKEERIRIYRETMDILKKNEYVAPSGNHVIFEKVHRPV